MGCRTADLPRLGQGLTGAVRFQTCPAPCGRGRAQVAPSGVFNASGGSWGLPYTRRHIAQQAVRTSADAWSVRRGVRLLPHNGSPHRCLER